MEKSQPFFRFPVGQTTMRASERRMLLKSSNKPVNIKYHNQKLILSLFRQADTLSIAEISDKIKLSKTTIAKVIGEFEEKGLISCVGKGDSTESGGKKPEIFAFNAAFAQVAAMAIRQDRIHGAVTDLRGIPLCWREAECGAEVDYGTALTKLAEMFAGLVRDAGIRRSRLCGLTLGCEGVVDAEKGLVRYTLQHDWGRNLDIGADLARRLPFPIRIRVDNSVRLAGYRHRDDDQLGTIVVVNSGRSTSGSVIEARDLIHGDNGFVGEFGHMVMDPSSDLKCRCGGRGCFEALVSPDRVLEAAKRRAADFPGSTLRAKAGAGGIGMADVFSAADAGDLFARALLEPVVSCFSLLLHNITLLRDPARIVIQGLYAGAGEYFLSSLRSRLKSIPFYKTEHEIAIGYARAEAGDPAVLGAARFGADEFLKGNRLYD